MDDAALVRRREAARDLNSEIHGLAHGQGALGDLLAQGLALDELHHEEMPGRGRGRTGDFFE